MDIITIYCIILVSLGILPLLMVLIKMRSINLFKKKAVTTSATITHIEKKRGFKGNIYSVLTLEYRTIDSFALFIKQSITTKKYETGQTIPLMYLPDKPDKFNLDPGNKYLYMAAICFVFFMLILWFCLWLGKLPHT